MRRIALRVTVLVVAAAVFAGIVGQSAFGITWCFDWVAYEVNRKTDVNRLNAGSLRALLRKLGYAPVLRVKADTGIPTPSPSDIRLAVERLAPTAQNVDASLKPGDVLLFGEFHTGIVRAANGRFDHFLQLPGRIGTAYSPPEAAKSPNYFVGPGKSWTLQQFFAFSRDQPPAHTHTWKWATWREWLGRLAFGAPKQYPFLRSTAEVWRRTGLQSGTYRAVAVVRGTAYRARWELTVTGSTITGKSYWECCPGPRTDPLNGTIKDGHVTIVRNCAGQGAPDDCRQTYAGAVEGDRVTGTISGSSIGPGSTFTLTPS
jgi:hypothetical protein